MSTDIERPLKLVWLHADWSASAMGDGFDRVVKVLRRVEEQDQRFDLPERFVLELR